jgi:Ca2+-transporting ATPase
MKYVRFQMVVLIGFILTFVGAAIFNIANGTPLIPLQVLWINFAIDVVLAVGLGFDRPTLGLMERRPRSPEEPVINRFLGVRLAIGGLFIAIGSLVVVAWAENREGLIVATTMGLTTMSLMHVVAALEWRDARRSLFSHDTLENGRLILLIVVVVALTLMATSLPILQRILDTTSLDGQHWRVILIPVAAYLVLSEIGKFIVRRFNLDHADATVGHD